MKYGIIKWIFLKVCASFIIFKYCFRLSYCSSEFISKNDTSFHTITHLFSLRRIIAQITSTSVPNVNHKDYTQLRFNYLTAQNQSVIYLRLFKRRPNQLVHDRRTLTMTRFIEHRQIYMGLRLIVLVTAFVTNDEDNVFYT